MAFLAGVKALAANTQLDTRVSVIHRNGSKRDNKNRAFKLLHEITTSVPVE